MTAAAVAAELRENGDDLVFEVNRDLAAAPFDTQREFGFRPLGAGHGNASAPVPQRCDHSCRVNFNDARGFRRIMNAAREITHLTRTRDAGDAQLLPSIATCQQDRLPGCGLLDSQRL